MSLLAERQLTGRAELGRELLSAIKSEPAAPSQQTGGDLQSLADALLRDATSAGASDVHLDPQRDDVALRFRIDGAMVDVANIACDPAQRVLNQFKTLANVDPVNLSAPVESRIAYPLDERKLDLRVAFAPCVTGEKLTVRLLDARRLRRDIRDLGLPEPMQTDVEQWLHDVSGMFLVTGPTGSGKTTTLYALVHELRLLERSIITLEDPVEYQIDGVTQLQVDPACDMSFDAGLKAMLRLDPDFLLLGEVRDVASARAAATAAASGHVLLSTLHSRDPVSAVTTLRHWGLQDHEIAAALKVVVSQRLVRRLCADCRRQEAPDPREARWLRAIGADAPETTWRAVGCEQCRGIGYRGRVGVFEVWRLRDADLDAIAQHAPERALREALRDRGHATLLGDALEKARSGATTVAELVGGRLTLNREASAGGADPPAIGDCHEVDEDA